MRKRCAFWHEHGLNAYADRDDILSITRRINGGTNGLADRKLYVARAKAVIGQIVAQDAHQAPSEVEATPVASEDPVAAHEAPSPVAEAPAPASKPSFFAWLHDKLSRHDKV